MESDSHTLVVSQTPATPATPAAPVSPATAIQVVSTENSVTPTAPNPQEGSVVEIQVSRPTFDQNQWARDLIANALKEDAECRVVGVTSGLYSLQDIMDARKREYYPNTYFPSRFGHGVPIIRGRRRAFNRWDIFNLPGTDDEFAQRLGVLAPWAADFDWRKYGMRIAGGAVSTILCHTPEQIQETTYDADDMTPRDYDIFLVGHDSDDEAKAAIVALWRHLCRHWENPSAMTTVDVYRTQNCITFTRREVPNAAKYNPIVQVILRRYSTDGEVIHGFDMGSCAMLWTGHQIVMTGLGKLALERGVNILNLQARRGSYEYRLGKYFSRGFDLVLPDLNVEGLGPNGDLPYLELGGFSRGNCPCSCYANEIRPAIPPAAADTQQPPPAAADTQQPPPQGKEEMEAASAPPKAAMPAKRTVASLPVAAISSPREIYPLNVEPVSFYQTIAIQYGSPEAVAAGNIQALRWRPVSQAYLCAYAQSHPDLDLFAIEPTIDLDTIAKKIHRDLSMPRTIATGTIGLLLDKTSMAELLTEYALKGGAPSIEFIKNICGPTVTKLNKDAHIKFAFMRVEENTALTGPFTRTVLAPRDWYGAKAFNG